MESAELDRGRLADLLRIGDADFLSDVIKLFLDNAARKIEAIRAASDLNDCGELELHSHALRSSAANIGAGQLDKLAARIEHAAMEGLTKPIVPIVTDLQSAYEGVKKLLEHELENLEHE